MLFPHLPTFQLNCPSLQLELYIIPSIKSRPLICITHTLYFMTFALKITFSVFSSFPALFIPSHHITTLLQSFINSYHPPHYHYHPERESLCPFLSLFSKLLSPEIPPVKLLGHFRHTQCSLIPPLPYHLPPLIQAHHSFSRQLRLFLSSHAVSPPFQFANKNPSISLCIKCNSSLM